MPESHPLARRRGSMTWTDPMADFPRRTAVGRASPTDGEGDWGCVGVSGDGGSVTAVPSQHIQRVVAASSELGKAASREAPRMALAAAPIATETKDLPLKDQAYLGGWKSPQTLLAVYERAAEATMREGLATRGSARSGASLGRIDCREARLDERTAGTDSRASSAWKSKTPPHTLKC